MRHLQKFYPNKFDLIAITVDLGYKDFNLDNINALCQQLDVPYYIVNTEIADIIFKQRKEDSPCSLCAKMRKGALNDKAKEFGVVDGVWVREIVDGGSAAGADIKVDDVIIGIDEKKVHNFADLQEALAKHRPGDKVTVKLIRDKKEKNVEVILKNEQGTTKVVKNAGMEILGAAFREIPADLKKQLKLGYGVEVTGVTNGKMKDAGVRKGFIILKANGEQIRKVSDLEEVLKAATKSPDQVLFLTGMFPSGKRANYAVDLTQE